MKTLNKLTIAAVFAITSLSANALIILDKPRIHDSLATVNDSHDYRRIETDKGIYWNLDDAAFSLSIMDPSDQSATPFGLAGGENQTKMNMSRGFKSDGAIVIGEKGRKEIKEKIACTLRYDINAYDYQVGTRWFGDLVCSTPSTKGVFIIKNKDLSKWYMKSFGVPSGDESVWGF